MVIFLPNRHKDWSLIRHLVIGNGRRKEGSSVPSVHFERLKEDADSGQASCQTTLCRGCLTFITSSRYYSSQSLHILLEEKENTCYIQLLSWKKLKNHEFHWSILSTLLGWYLLCILFPPQVRGGDSHLLLYSPETQPEVLCSALGPQHKEDMDLLEQVKKRAMKMMRGLKRLSYEGRRRQLGFFSLKKTRHWGDLIAAFQYL